MLNDKLLLMWKSRGFVNSLMMTMFAVWMLMGWQIFPSHAFGRVPVTSGRGQPSRPRTGWRLSSSSTTSGATSPDCTGWWAGRLLTSKFNQFTSRCRVDFRDAPSSNSFLNLDIIGENIVTEHNLFVLIPSLWSVLPKKVVIFDEKWSERNTFVGPYLEGDDMNLICEAVGGGFWAASWVHREHFLSLYSTHVIMSFLKHRRF